MTQPRDTPNNAVGSSSIATDSEPAHRARTFRIAALGTALSIALIAAAMNIIEPAGTFRRATTILIVLGVCPPLLWLNKKGKTGLASILLVGLLLALCTFRVSTGGGVSGPTTAAYIALVLLAGLLLGNRGAIVTVAVALAACTVLTLVEVNGLLPATEVPVKPWTTLMLYTAWLSIAAVVQHMFVNSLSRASRAARAELESRRKVQDKLDLALEASGIGVWELDPATMRVHGDARVLKMYGLDPDPLGIAWPDLVARIHPDHQPMIEQTLKNARAGTTQPVTEFMVVRPAQDPRWILALTGPPGEAGRLSGLLIDITDRKAAEREREALVTRLSERVKELRLLHTAAQMLQSEAPLDQQFLDQLVLLIPPAWQHPEVCQARISFGAICATSGGWRGTGTMQTAKRSTAAGELCIQVEYTEPRPEAAEGPFLAEERQALESLTEILARQIDLARHRHGLEELVETRTRELRALEKLRDDLVQMVVHDMRSPLTALLMSLDLISARVGPELSRAITAAIRTAGTLNRMANDLLDISRMEQARVVPKAAPVDLSELARTACATLQMMDRERAIEVECEGTITASCDGEMIRRVLENLISNGIKHTPTGGRIVVRLSTRQDRARVEVIDQGPGVPVEARHKIFEKFGTIESRKEQKFHSVGLGLVFCKFSVEAHGGSIGVDDAPGGGAVFWFEVPAERMPSAIT